MGLPLAGCFERHLFDAAFPPPFFLIWYAFRLACATSGLGPKLGGNIIFFSLGGGFCVVFGLFDFLGAEFVSSVKGIVLNRFFRAACWPIGLFMNCVVIL